MDLMTFLDRYDRWREDCLHEFNETFGEKRKYYAIPDHDYDPGEVVEFSESGEAYPHGRGGTNWIPRCVTPWERSPHYTR